MEFFAATKAHDFFSFGPVADILGAMGRTKHLLKPEFNEILSEMQKNID